MKTTFGIVHTEISCQAMFSEALLNLLKDGYQISIIKELMDAYSIKFSDFKFNKNDLPSAFVRFSKFDNETYLEVSFGIESLNSIVRQPSPLHQKSSVRQPLERIYKLFDLIDIKNFDFLRINIARHLSTEGNVNNFLDMLNPHTPEGFKGDLSEKGVNYTLNQIDKKVTTYITVMNSRHVPGGLFLHASFEFSDIQSFSPDRLDLENIYGDLLNELKIEIGKEN